MDEQYWEKVLDALYKAGGYGEYPTRRTEQELDQELDLEQLTGLSRFEIADAVEKLKRAGLATEEEVTKIPTGAQGPVRMGVQVSKLGFEVGHQRRVEKQRQEHEQALRKSQIQVEKSLLGKQNTLTSQLTIFTAALVITGAVQALASVRFFPPDTRIFFIMLLSVLIGIIFGFIGDWGLGRLLQGRTIRETWIQWRSDKDAD